LADEVIEALCFALDAVEVRGHRWVCVFAGELERNAEAGERRTQLVRDIAQEQCLCVDERLETLSHVVEVVCERVELISAKGTELRRLLHARGEVALRQCARGFAQADDGACEEQYECEGGDAADGDGDGQLRKGEVEDVLIQGGLLLDPLHGEEEEVFLSRCGSGRDAPQVLIAYTLADGLGCVAQFVRESEWMGRGTNRCAIRILKHKDALVFLRHCVERSAAAGLEGFGCGERLGLNFIEERVEDELRMRDAMANDEGRGENKDEALRNPEDDEDFEEQAAHLVKPQWWYGRG